MGKRLVSIVIPVYNEEQILEQAVTGLYRDIERHRADFDFEVMLAENGSKDGTIAKGQELAGRFSGLSIFHHPEPDYGNALKAGIRRARGDIVVCDEIDLCLPEFYEKALAIFKAGGIQMVVGSKAMKGAKDERPFKRRFATFVLNFLLKLFLGFRGTDTHGVKAFLREPLMPVLDRCLVGRDIFASEFVIRAERAGIAIREIPISLDEKRAPSIRLLKRVPRVLSNLVCLFWAIRIKRG